MSIGARRRFLGKLGAGILLCLARDAVSQPVHRMRRVAVYGGIGNKKKFFDDFAKELARQGWREGAALTVRHFEKTILGTGTLPERQARAIAEVLAWNPDVVATGHTRDAQALQRATTSVPIVFAWVDDPVKAGLVRDLARPGGNVTGAMNSEAILAVKRLQVTRELFPGARRIAVVVSESSEAHFRELMEQLQEEARKLHVELAKLSLRAEGDVSEMIAAIEAAQPRAVIMVGGLSFGKGTVESIERAMDGFAARSGVPFIANEVESVAERGLIAVAEPRAELFRRSAGLVARILAGAKPSELPVDQAMRLELWINLATASKLGIVVPPALLARADRIIQ